jgi:hypothetical protein
MLDFTDADSSKMSFADAAERNEEEVQRKPAEKKSAPASKNASAETAKPRTAAQLDPATVLRILRNAYPG